MRLITNGLVKQTNKLGQTDVWQESILMCSFSRNHLKRHMNNCVLENPNWCALYEKSFISRRNLKRHKKTAMLGRIQIRWSV